MTTECYFCKQEKECSEMSIDVMDDKILAQICIECENDLEFSPEVQDVPEMDEEDYYDTQFDRDYALEMMDDVSEIEHLMRGDE